MNIDFWGLGLQAVNVLILVWLLSRLFWHPVADAIAQRQKTAQTVTEAARVAQEKADATLAEVTRMRDGIAAERTAVLDAARAEADKLAKSALSEARAKAEALQSAAKAAIARESEVAERANAAQASDLSLEIAARLLAQLNGPLVQSAFLAQLIDAIGKLPTAERASLGSGLKRIEIVTASDPRTEREMIEKAVRKALGGAPDLIFVIDPVLIAGVELRSAHFVLHNSWRAELAQVRKAVKDAA